MQSNLKKIDHFYYDTTSKPLGKGAFGTVFKATDETTNQPVAMKVIPSVKLLESDTQYNLFMREINVLRGIKGSHIVQLQDVKRTPNNLYIVTDFCDGGDLEKKIKSGHQFGEEEALSILRQIVDAFVTIEDMHLVNSRGQKMTVMHRDIKAANVLFHQGQIKVADFGFAKFIEEVNKDKRQANTLLGTPLYMPPQILNNETYSSKCDIWSTGCLFYEILFGKLPYTGHSVPNLYSNIKTKPVTFPKKIKEETQQLIIHMLKVREEDRLSWKEIRDHPALKKSSPTGVQHQQQQNIPVYNGFPQMNFGGKVVSQGQGQKQESYQQSNNHARIPLQAVTKNISH